MNLGTRLAMAVVAVSAATGAACSGSGDGSSSSGGFNQGPPGDCPIFPADNAWNQDISNAEVDPLSDTYIASIGASTTLHPDFGTIYGIPFANVDDSVTKTKVSFNYADESDKGPYPIPANPPIENGGDAHLLMVQTDECKLYELYAAHDNGGAWHAGSGAIWDLKSDALRPKQWTSADAAGLPIYPGLAKYDEAMSSEGITHALRFTVSSSQSAFVSPARHSAGSNDKTLPPMGLRVRLKASVDITGYKPELKAVLTALKKYGMFVADNGSDWYISGAPDKRWSDDNLHAIDQLQGSDFEAIKTGPLTPGD